MSSGDSPSFDPYSHTPGPKDGNENVHIVLLPLETMEAAIKDFQEFEVRFLGGTERPDPARSRLVGRRAVMTAFFTPVSTDKEPQDTVHLEVEHYISYALPGGRLFRPKPDAMVQVMIDLSSDPRFHQA